MSSPQIFKQRFTVFKSYKRGYYSLIVLLLLVGSTLFLELLVNSRALIVHYNGDYYFPVIAGFYNEKTFGGEAEYEVDYRQLKNQFAEEGLGNWVLMPLVPYNPYESIFNDYANPPPNSPSFSDYEPARHRYCRARYIQPAFLCLSHHHIFFSCALYF